MKKHFKKYLYIFVQMHQLVSFHHPFIYPRRFISNLRHALFWRAHDRQHAECFSVFCFTNSLEVSHRLVLALTDSCLWLPNQMGSFMFSCQRHVWHDVSNRSRIPSLLRAEVQTPNQLDEIDSIILVCSVHLGAWISNSCNRESSLCCTDAPRAIKPCFSVADMMTFSLQCIFQTTILTLGALPTHSWEPLAVLSRHREKWWGTFETSTEEATAFGHLLVGAWAFSAEPEFPSSYAQLRSVSVFSVFNRETESTNKLRSNHAIHEEIVLHLYLSGCSEASPSLLRALSARRCSNSLSFLKSGDLKSVRCD